MKHLLLISLALIVSLSSCTKENTEGNIITDAKLAKELRSNPETITIGNDNLILVANLWREFMPDSEENGSKLFCVSNLREIDSRAISENITLRRQYVIKGDQIWVINYRETRNNLDSTFEGMVKDGPKWGPDIKVDVVCEFDACGTMYKILAKSQWINKAE